MSFHDVRFPAALSVGSSGGPERRTEIVTLSNGFEERNSPWAHSRRRYDAGLGVRSLDDLAEVVAFFEARQRAAARLPLEGLGGLTSPCAPSAAPAPLDQRIGTGDGSRDGVSRWCKRYASGGADLSAADRASRWRARCGWRSAALCWWPGPASSSIHATGAVHFARRRATGAPVTAGFEFDVPVRFDTDRIAVEPTRGSRRGRSRRSRWSRCGSDAGDRSGAAGAARRRGDDALPLLAGAAARRRRARLHRS